MGVKQTVLVLQKFVVMRRCTVTPFYSRYNPSRLHPQTETKGQRQVMLVIKILYSIMKVKC